MMKCEGKPQVLYVCDRKRCEVCNDYCEHTTDIAHAANFYEDAIGGVWIERDGVVALGEIDEFSKMSEKQNIEQDW